MKVMHPSKIKKSFVEKNCNKEGGSSGTTTYLKGKINLGRGFIKQNIKLSWQQRAAKR